MADTNAVTHPAGAATASNPNADTPGSAPSRPPKSGKGGRARGRGRGRGGGKGRGRSSAVIDGATSTTGDNAALMGAEYEVHSAAAAATSSAVDDSTTDTGAKKGKGDKKGKDKKGKDKKRAREGIAEDGEGIVESTEDTLNKRAKPERKEQAPRPTHFLSLSLATDPELRARLAAFNDALLASDPPIAGLDKSIVIDPRRVHLTLGVMCLEREDAISPVHAATDVNDASNIDANPTSATSGTASLPDSPPKKTIASALALLRSLAPQLMALGPARVDLDRLGVLKTQKGGREANVLWVGPRDEGGDDKGLRVKDNERDENDGGESHGSRKSSLHAIADLVHQAFRRERYITETRPLKLHVTLLNTTHRKKPRRRLAFSYVDVLRAEAAMGVLGAVVPGLRMEGDDVGKAAPADAGLAKAVLADTEKAALDAEAQEQIAAGGDAIVPTAGARREIAEVVAEEEVEGGAGKGTKASHSPEVDIAMSPPPSAPLLSNTFTVPRTPIPIALGSYTVRAVHLCAMGSHGPDNEYVSVGGVEF